MQDGDGSTSAPRRVPAGDRVQPVHYEIRVEGHLDARWSAWFDRLHLTHDDDGTTTLHGPVADQAALHGVLQRLRDLAVPLVSVTPVDGTAPPAHPRTGAPDAATHEGR
jgi:hypothetical protein